MIVGLLLGEHMVWRSRGLSGQNEFSNQDLRGEEREMDFSCAMRTGSFFYYLFIYFAIGEKEIEMLAVLQN